MNPTPNRKATEDWEIPNEAYARQSHRRLYPVPMPSQVSVVATHAIDGASFSKPCSHTYHGQHFTVQGSGPCVLGSYIFRLLE